MRTQSDFDYILAASDIGLAMLRLAHSDLDWTDSLDAISEAMHTHYGVSNPQTIRKGLDTLLRCSREDMSMTYAICDIAIELDRTTVNKRS